MTSPAAAPKLSMTQVLLCGAAIVTLSMGIRHGFGLWLAPITMERGWTRETFAFAIAVQNLAWGVAGPVAGALADRFGAFKVIAAGALLYAAGLVLMALSTSAWPSPAAPACCSAWRSRAPPMR
jgi:MFS family permease